MVGIFLIHISDPKKGNNAQSSSKLQFCVHDIMWDRHSLHSSALNGLER